MAKKVKPVKVSHDDIEDFIWMSYRYCIGRHTIAAAYHAGTITKYVKDLTPTRQEFMATDIRREISDILQFRSNFHIDGFCMNMDAISLFLKWLTTNPIDFTKELVSENKFTIDTNTGVVYIDPIELGDKRNDLAYETLCTDIRDALPWMKLANYLDVKCHKYIELEGKVYEAFPYYAFDKDIPEEHWVTCENYESNPNVGWYIVPDKIKFVNNPEIIKSI